MNTLLNYAKTDIMYAKLGLNSSTDEIVVKYGAYHVQQAVEKTIKFLLGANGVQYQRTHDIGTLVVLAQLNNINIPNDIVLQSNRLTLWESRTRYINNLRVGYNAVMALINYTDNWINTVAQSYNINL